MDSAQPIEDLVGASPVAEVMPKLDRRKLRGFERISVPVCDGVNGTFWLKKSVQFFVRTVTSTWIFGIARRRLLLEGLEHVRTLDPPRGVILVSNHRSFFDMYVCSAVLYKRARFLSRLHFPVRSKFFYTNPLGLLVNLCVSGCAMWPPMFRDERKHTFNPTALRQVGHILSGKGSVLGYHPEGTRGKGPDPYVMLRPKKGIGLLLDQCHPETLVVPFFIVGMGNTMSGEIKACARPRRGENDIRLRFGEPVQASEFQDNMKPAEVAEKVMDRVRELAEQDRLQQAG